MMKNVAKTQKGIKLISNQHNDQTTPRTIDHRVGLTVIAAIGPSKNGHAIKKQKKSILDNASKTAHIPAQPSKFAIENCSFSKRINTSRPLPPYAIEKPILWNTRKCYGVSPITRCVVPFGKSKQATRSFSFENQVPESNPERVVVSLSDTLSPSCWTLTGPMPPSIRTVNFSVAKGAFSFKRLPTCSISVSCFAAQ